MPDTLAVLVGLVAGVAGLVLPTFLRSTDDALAVGAVVLAAFLGGAGLAPVAVVVAVGLVVVGATLGPPVRWSSVAASAALLGLAVPGPADVWLGVAAGIGVAMLVPLVQFDVGSLGPRTTLALLAWVPFAVYAAVPDTEEITAVGVALAVLAVGHLRGGRQISPAGLGALAALVVWATAVGARGREAAFVTVACFGVLALGPLVSAFRRRVDWRSAPGLSLALAHVVGGVAVARWAGLGRDVGAASLRALVVGALVAIVGGFAIAASPPAET